MSHKLSVSVILCAISILQTAGQTFEPKLPEAEGLICYQCNSMSTNPKPLCDPSFFSSATDEEKKNMTFHCPHYQGQYCFTKINRLGQLTETVRGCSGGTDKKNNTLKTGCLATRKMMYCLCNTNLCNRNEPPNMFDIRLYILAIILILLSNNIHFQ